MLEAVEITPAKEDKMQNLMHYELVSQASRDRSERLIGEAAKHRLARAARPGRQTRQYRPSIAELFDRARAIRRPAHIRA